MGITKDEAVIATGGTSDASAIIRFREQMPKQYRQLLVGPISRANAVASFALMPDGSSEGSAISEEMDRVRAAFIALIESLGMDWAHIILFDETAAMVGKDPGPRIAARGEYIRDGEYYRRKG